MPPPRFAKVQVDDEALDRVQDRIKVATDALANVPFMDGILLENVGLVSGSFNPVSHRLSRPWRGFIIVSRSANATVWNQTAGADAGAFLYLQPSANVTVNLWVF